MPESLTDVHPESKDANRFISRLGAIQGAFPQTIRGLNTNTRYFDQKVEVAVTTTFNTSGETRIPAAKEQIISAVRQFSGEETVTTDTQTAFDLLVLFNCD